MHAASVHPEPGSNSRNHGIKTFRRMIQSVCFRVFLLAFVLLLKSSNSLERIYEIMFAHTKLICFVLHLLLFSFQRSMRPADPALPVRIPSVPLCAFSLRQPIYYTTFRSVCQGVFEKFFEVFFKPLFLLPSSPVFQRYPCPFTGALDYYTTFLPVCQVGFEKFFEVFSVGFRSSTSRSVFASAFFHSHG